MTTIHCWRLESRDLDHANSLVARFTTQEEAENASSCAGGYGPAINPETIMIYHSAIEFNPKLNKVAVQSGMAKLTDEEKMALGLIK